MIAVYGIKNCDTCRKALKWLEAEGVEHRFHDFRKDGLEVTAVSRWVKSAGWEKLLNRRGTTWRNLSEGDKEEVDEAKAKALMADNPTLIKRPVFEFGTEIVIGFGATEKAALKT
jgi:arsenate reductase